MAKSSRIEFDQVKSIQVFEWGSSDVLLRRDEDVPVMDLRVDGKTMVSVASGTLTKELLYGWFTGEYPGKKDGNSRYHIEASVSDWARVMDDIWQDHNSRLSDDRRKLALTLSVLDYETTDRFIMKLEGARFSISKLGDDSGPLTGQTLFIDHGSFKTYRPAVLTAIAGLSKFKMAVERSACTVWV